MSAVPARSYEHFDDPVPPPEPVAVPARPRRRTGAGGEAPAGTGAAARRPVTEVPAPERGARTRVADVPAPERGGRKRPVADDPAPQRGTADRRRTRRSESAVPAPEPVTAPRTPFVMVVLVLVSAGIIGLLVLNTKINENSFQLQGMRDRQSSLDTREQQLKSALADKQSPGNLAAAAKRLGLVRADSPAFLHLPDGRVLGVPQPGGAGGPGAGSNTGAGGGTGGGAGTGGR